MIHLIVGARPNFMKVAPLHRALHRRGVEARVVHTGQHYDARMSDVFFEQLDMPRPDVYLEVGSGSHAVQTARIMMAYEEVVEAEKPALVVVVGDVNSTVACSLVAVKRHIPVAHVEAGLRSEDRRMPEEINRIVTDSISDYLFVTEQSGLDNLRNEGVATDKVFFVGNTMIDTLVHLRARAAAAPILEQLGLMDTPFALMTMHRPSNVDHRAGLEKLLDTVRQVAARLRVVLPLHPRTRNHLEQEGLLRLLQDTAGVTVCEPLGYLPFLRLMEAATVVVTDSGGIQEETTYLGVPCLTLRENTERPSTVTLGTNQLLAFDPAVIIAAVEAVLQGSAKQGHVPPLWDGQAAERIADVLVPQVVREPF